MKEFSGVKKRKMTDTELNKKPRRYKPKIYDDSKQKKKKKETKTPPNHTKKYRKQKPREAFESEYMEDFKTPNESENTIEEEVGSESPSKSEIDTATLESGFGYDIFSPRKYSSRRTLEFELENPLPQETTEEDTDVDNKPSIFSILTTNLGSDIEDFDICLEKDVGGWQTQELALMDCLVNFPELYKKPRKKRLRIDCLLNFPELYKKPRKKRLRKKINLLDVLTFYKGEMDARKLRSGEKGPLSNQKRMNRLIFGKNQVQHDNDIGLLIRELESLHLHIKEDEPLDTVKPLDLVPVKPLDLVPVKPLDLVPYPESKEISSSKPKSKKKKYKPKAVLDKETLRRWKILMANDVRGGKRLLKNVADTCEDEKKDWNDKTEKLLRHLEIFITRLNFVQGNRKLSHWNGSVVDSVIGVYLTQNVSDAQSSSAYMEIASRHPVQNNSQLLLLGPTNQDAPLIQSPNAEKIYGLSQDENGTNEINVDDSADNVRKDTSTDGGKEEKADRKDNKNAKGKKKFDWDKERLKYSSTGLRHVDTMDSVDWNSVRNAPLDEIKDAIKKRGMYNTLAKKIQNFLIETELKDNGDLEWLRNAPDDVVQGYLLSKDGLGLKSVECIRLLALNQHAFPVDVNVARIATRLGWVPLQELPDDMNFDQLEEYPNADAIQKYLWPRLCTLSTEALYELHYHLITFGKVFCTKLSPNCSACPLKDECKHYASANSRLNLNLPAPEQTKSHHMCDPVVVEYEEALTNIGLENISNHDGILENCESTVELPHSPEPYQNLELSCDVREREGEDVLDTDIEDMPEIHMPKTKEEEYIASITSALEFYGMHWPDLMNALVPAGVSFPEQKSKNKIENRLKSIHNVYILEDGHPLLKSFDKRVTGDPCPYLLAIWDSTDIITGNHSNKNGVSTESDENEQVRGTILIPSRTAMGGRFPLNGTYFQINEVFADDESSYSHVLISKKELSRLQTRPLYCGTSIYSICRGMSLPEIIYCFIHGSICVRGFNRNTRGPKPLNNHLFGGLTSKKKLDEERYEYEDSI